MSKKKTSAVIGNFVLKNTEFCLKKGGQKPMEFKTKLSTDLDKTPRLGRRRKYATRAERNAAYYQNKKLRPEYPPLPSGPYRVIYADPPWQYANDGMQKYGHAAFHYPTLSIKALLQLPIKQIAEKNAVLFLWVTAPMLFACVPIVEAWGFEYKTQMVWDKGRHNYGHYVGIQTENLLICVRGRCRPDIHELPSNLRRIPRTKHSTKPEEFRLLIDRLYPEGRRLELFARTHVEGWDAWGNELAQKKEEENGFHRIREAGD